MADGVRFPVLAGDPPPDEEVTSDGTYMPRSLEPTVMPEGWHRSKSRRGMFAGLLLAAAVAAIVAFVVIARIPKTQTSDPAVEPSSLPSRFAAQGSGEAPRTRPAPPQLMVNPAAARPGDEPAPLGVLAYGAGGGAGLMIEGLAAGSGLSAGEPRGSHGWWLPIADLGNAAIVPPRGFAGAMELTAELRLADGTLADRKGLRFEWSPRPPPAAARPAPAAAKAAPTPAPKPALRPLDAEEIAMLLKRGGELIASGNIVAARLVYRHAAEAGEARAAFALAETYDPLVLERLGTKGLSADVAMAQTWYEKARELGSTEAPRRLEMLAKRN